MKSSKCKTWPNLTYVSYFIQILVANILWETHKVRNFQKMDFQFGREIGLVVSVFAFYPENASSNSAEAYSFLPEDVWKERK